MNEVLEQEIEKIYNRLDYKGMLKECATTEDSVKATRIYYLYIKSLIISGEEEELKNLDNILELKELFDINALILRELSEDKLFIGSYYGDVLKQTLENFMDYHRDFDTKEENKVNIINELIVYYNRFPKLLSKTTQKHNHILFISNELEARGLKSNIFAYRYVLKNIALLTLWDYLYYIENYKEEKAISVKGRTGLITKLNTMSNNKIMMDYLPVDNKMKETYKLVREVE